MVPQVAPEQPLPLTDQETVVLVVPPTVAVNCRLRLTFTDAVVGATEMVVGETLVLIDARLFVVLESVSLAKTSA